ncbi:MAG: hypothetical protein JXQ81_00265 [Desulfuromonadales bacterium]|nr:hypothetical protein [Desulfuromonadales bacterium]MBN2790918.1 hypothetical protein [Desulfuromonadales bacterium]
MKRVLLTCLTGLVSLLMTAGVALAGDVCIDCHSNISPGQVKDWEASKHAGVGVT